LAGQVGASGLFDGQGGDQMFFSDRPDLGAVDFAYNQGISPGLLRISYDAAYLERLSVWRILGQSLRYGVLKRPYNPVSDGIFGKETILNSDVQNKVEGSTRFLHPWFLGSHQPLMPGKRWHIFSLNSPLTIYSPESPPNDLHRVSVMMSQPIFEACLRIPTYLLTNRRRPRALLRDAFAASVPSQITRRHSKGGVEELSRDVLLNNTKLIRELLLDGVLVKRNYIDRHKLESVLSRDPTPTRAPIVTLWNFLSIEAWLHSLSSIKQSVAA